MHFLLFFCAGRNDESMSFASGRVLPCRNRSHPECSAIPRHGRQNPIHRAAACRLHPQLPVHPDRRTRQPGTRNDVPAEGSAERGAGLPVGWKLRQPGTGLHQGACTVVHRGSGVSAVSRGGRGFQRCPLRWRSAVYCRCGEYWRNSTPRGWNATSRAWSKFGHSATSVEPRHGVVCMHSCSRRSE